eukprot:CAMPEP_0206043932 /NCGR_PEP_ID=MMETSP1466-20131121/10855_1 /ASSEMBLY_ACC=CAM_ASM_001126 /TAXON_ID=44452 /ORGANISM="Pavlova gyrans, Strain CCMP608" /LENGTH=31 /DNA_ID= /DNA_START= /DNA_END= /DNA_ORIENTATION=
MTPAHLPPRHGADHACRPLQFIILNGGPHPS